MSASCPRPSNRPAHCSGSGFTLLELLVVLAIIGLAAGLVLPGFARLAASTEHSVDRQALRASLNGLSYRVQQGSRAYTLASDTISHALSDGKPALVVPDGWKVDVAQPVKFSGEGVCLGGQLSVQDPDGLSETIRLEAPACLVKVASE